MEVEALLAKFKMERRNMDYITPEKMREVDVRPQEEFGIPATILMENAGRSFFQAAMEMLSEKREKKVTVCLRERPMVETALLLPDPTN